LRAAIALGTARRVPAELFATGRVPSDLHRHLERCTLGALFLLPGDGPLFRVRGGVGVNVRWVVFLLANFLCSVALSHAQVDTSIVPAEGRTTWTPGIPGGVPVRTSICTQLNASSYGNGSQDASSAIQAAVNGCPVGQVVLLSAGTFRVNNHVLINKGVTVRGMGPGVTKLQKTNGAVPFSYVAADTQPIFIIGPSRWPKVNDSTSANLTQDGASGATSVTVSNAGGFAAGQFVLVDEDNFNTASWMPLPDRYGSPTNVQIWASDRAVFMRHNPPDGVDDGFPESLTWFSRSGRPIAEVKEIASVSGNVLTFTTPLHISYRTSKMAQVTRYDAVHVKNAGIENMSLTGGGGSNIRFEAAAYSWVKNVENDLWLGEGIAANFSFRIEIRDSYIHDAAWPVPGGGGYALSLANGTAGVLIENNIVMRANKMMVARSSGAGSVVGYNYMDNGFIWKTEDWVEVGINGSHQVGSHHILFEGNASFNYDSDNTHGNAIAMTIFRNHLIGRRRDFPGMSNGRTAGLMFGSWWHSFIGNVMGEPGRMAGWIYEDPGDGTYGHSTSAWGSSPAIWKLGYDPTHWFQAADPKVKSTTLRDGNFDYLTNQVRWDRPERALPPSLYLTSKPAFFGNNPWPWVDPLGTQKLGVLPAKLRFESGAASGGGGGGATSAPQAPTNLRIQK
jgi:hypothetical protein